ncbi:hypothetical protein [Mesotoga sp.]|uniref:hypothetical protein n=1 Tax=Mesotoga sp. TaxID=2053577 RepID=UPI00345E30B2
MFEEVTKGRNARMDKESAEFDIHDVLKDSLYYPACGHDGHPVKVLHGKCL